VLIAALPVGRGGLLRGRAAAKTKLPATATHSRARGEATSMAEADLQSTPGARLTM